MAGGFAPVPDWNSMLWHKKLKLLLTVRVGGFKRPGPSDNLAKGLQIVGSAGKTDEPQALGKCLGCNHVANEVMINRKKVKWLKSYPGPGCGLGPPRTRASLGLAGGLLSSSFAFLFSPLFPPLSPTPHPGRGGAIHRAARRAIAAPPPRAPLLGATAAAAAPPPLQRQHLAACRAKSRERPQDRRRPTA